MAGAFSGTVTGYVAKDPEAKANGKAYVRAMPSARQSDRPRIGTSGNMAMR